MFWNSGLSDKSFEGEGTQLWDGFHQTLHPNLQPPLNPNFPWDEMNQIIIITKHSTGTNDSSKQLEDIEIMWVSL